MKKRGISLAGAAFAALILIVLVFLMRLSLHRPAEVILPEPQDAESRGDTVSGSQQEAIRRVEVTPETVQRIIARLARPENYSRSITVERYWSGGSGQSTAVVRVAGGWMQADITERNEEVRHIITGEGKSWIWYGAGERIYTGPAVLSTDEEQGIPTYEDILLLDPADIAAADYRALDTVNCIYVETKPDGFGYVDRWWVSVENGLLVAAERVQGEGVVYRMAGLAVEIGGARGAAFQLPDGEILFRADAEE